jgi:hypothetical protein
MFNRYSYPRRAVLGFVRDVVAPPRTSFPYRRRFNQYSRMDDVDTWGELADAVTHRAVQSAGKAVLSYGAYRAVKAIYDRLVGDLGTVFMDRFRNAVGGTYDAVKLSLKSLLEKFPTYDGVKAACLSVVRGNSSTAVLSPQSGAPRQEAGAVGEKVRYKKSYGSKGAYSSVDRNKSGDYKRRVLVPKYKSLFV